MGRKVQCVGNSKWSRRADNTNTEIEVKENQDAIQLSAIFPEEIWRMILIHKVGAKFIDGNDTLATCSLASPYFRQLLTDRKIYFLFPKVLDILAIWQETAERKTGCNHASLDSAESDDETTNSASNFAISQDKTSSSILNSFFKQSDILKCREVCSKWNKYFQDHYQNSHRYSDMKNDINALSRNLGVFKMSMRDSNLDRHPQAFLDRFKETHCRDDLSSKINPFPARAIIFENVYVAQIDSMGDEDENFREGMLALLVKFGKELWHCNMELEDMNILSRIDFYWQFKDWLTLMPNLKTFQVNCSHLITYSQRHKLSKVLDTMQADISLNPLPELKNLQILKVEFLAAVIFNEIIYRSGHNITQLELTRDVETEDGIDYDIYSDAFPLVQLKELSINFGSVKHFEPMENSLVPRNWKLEKFYFVYDEEADFLDWSRILRMIGNNWPDSISDLILQMPEAIKNEDKYLVLEASLSTTILQLTSLKRVKLIIRNPCSLDFLLPSKDSLEHIEVIANYNVDQEKGRRYYKMLERRQCVKFLGFENSTDKFASNILEKFPKLKLYKIRTI